MLCTSHGEEGQQGADRSAKGVWRIITALFSLYEVAGFSMPEMRGVLPWPWLLSLNVRGADDGVPHSSACTCPDSDLNLQSHGLKSGSQKPASALLAQGISSACVLGHASGQD